MILEKRATFSNLWLAAAFIAPQILLVFIFFYWPSGEALYWAVTLEPPFGGSNEWVGWLEFRDGLLRPEILGLGARLADLRGRRDA